MRTTIKLSVLKAMFAALLCGAVMVCSVAPAKAQNGVTYTYDAAGNRITRRPNTIVLGAALIKDTSGIDDVLPAVIDDSLLGDALRVRHLEGSRSFDVLLDDSLLADNGSIEILSSTPEALPLLRLGQVETLQNLDMGRFSAGEYVMRITLGNTLSVWSIVIA